MPGPATQGARRTRSVLALALLGLVLGATIGAITPGAQASVPATVTFKPVGIGYSAPEIANPTRGQYAWLGQAAQPAGSPAMDTYYRDQVMWNQIEPTAGQYDFGWFDRGLADAASQGGRFGFRVMAWCPGCWRGATPSWLALQPGTAIPAWNSAAFLDGWDRLMKALGTRYANDPRLGWIDVGGYGRYGEWHTDGAGTDATPASMSRMIRAVSVNFPRQHVVINAMNVEGVKLAMALSPRIGLRADCLGEYNMFSLIPTSPSMQQRWKTAPVITEWCHTTGTSTVTGAAQVRKYHVSLVSSGNTVKPYTSMSQTQKDGWVSAFKRAGYRYQLRSLTLPRTVRQGRAFTLHTTLGNVGSAPTYDDWRIDLRLVDSHGKSVASTPMRIDLRTLLSGSSTYARSLSLQAAPGTYRLGVAVVDRTGYLAPMRLATTGRATDGTYLLGTVRVTR
jgi:hypothetical protein